MRISGMVVERKGGPFLLQELELAEPRPTELRVRVVASGICATDLHLRDQDYPVPLPIVLGHEGAGVVEAVGAGVDGIAPGDHVVLSYPSCQRCAHCRGGMNAYCLDSFRLCFGGARLDGSTALRRFACDGGDAVHGPVFAQSSFATHAIADRSNVVPVPKDLPLDRLAPLGWQRHTHQFTPGKNFIGTGAFGPWMVTPDEVGPLDDLRLQTRLNGAVMQDARLGEMIFGVARQIAYCSTFTRLEPGDVIATGTPGGVGARRQPPIWLKPDDRIEVVIDRVGTLGNVVVDEIGR